MLNSHEPMLNSLLVFDVSDLLLSEVTFSIFRSNKKGVTNYKGRMNVEFSDSDFTGTASDKAARQILTKHLTLQH